MIGVVALYFKLKVNTEYYRCNELSFDENLNKNKCFYTLHHDKINAENNTYKRKAR